MARTDDATIPCIKIQLHPSDPELDELLETLDYVAIGTVVQRRNDPDPKTYIGSGKLLDIAYALKRHSLGEGSTASGTPRNGEGQAPAATRRGSKRSRSASDAPPRVPGGGASSRHPLPRLVVDRALTPSQHHNLEHILTRRHGLHVDVRDRFLIVLEIFERRAATKEAKLQVELARLNYMTPFVKEWFHAGVAGEHPGFMAGGEYGVEEFLRYIRRRTVAIGRELEQSEKRGESERRSLKERGWAIFGLAGYTNAGKSTLFSALSGVAAERDQRMFTTLSPKSAGVTIGSDGRALPRGRVRLLVEDTIGFIEGMPANLIDGFRTTLRRLRAADLTLLVVDGSDPPEEVERKVRTCLSALGSEGVRELFPVLSKQDKGDAERRAAAATVVERLAGRVPFQLSALGGAGINRVLDAALSSTPAFTRIEVELSTALPASTLPKLAELLVDYRVAADGDRSMVRGWCRVEVAPRVRALAEK